MEESMNLLSEKEELVDFLKSNSPIKSPKLSYNCSNSPKIRLDESPVFRCRKKPEIQIDNNIQTATNGDNHKDKDKIESIEKHFIDFESNTLADDLFGSSSKRNDAVNRLLK